MLEHHRQHRTPAVAIANDTAAQAGSTVRIGVEPHSIDACDRLVGLRDGDTMALHHGLRTEPPGYLARNYELLLHCRAGRGTGRAGRAVGLIA